MLAYIPAPWILWELDLISMTWRDPEWPCEACHQQVDCSLLTLARWKPQDKCGPVRLPESAVESGNDLNLGIIFHYFLIFSKAFSCPSDLSVPGINSSLFLIPSGSRGSTFGAWSFRFLRAQRLSHGFGMFHLYISYFTYIDYRYYRL